jgi:hypothetical protein
MDTVFSNICAIFLLTAVSLFLFWRLHLLSRKRKPRQVHFVVKYHTSHLRNGRYNICIYICTYVYIYRYAPPPATLHLVGDSSICIFVPFLDRYINWYMYVCIYICTCICIYVYIHTEPFSRRAPSRKNEYFVHLSLSRSLSLSHKPTDTHICHLALSPPSLCLTLTHLYLMHLMLPLSLVHKHTHPNTQLHLALPVSRVHTHLNLALSLRLPRTPASHASGTFLARTHTHAHTHAHAHTQFKHKDTHT